MSRLLSPPLTPDLVDHYTNTHNLHQDEDSLFTNQILDLVFTSRPNEKLGFGVRADEVKKCLQINRIDADGEAHRVGLKKGDIILAVNDWDIGKVPKIGLHALKECKSINDEDAEIRITICRRIFDHIMIKVQRSGIHRCNGKYYFNHLDEEYDSPVFINKETHMLLLKANYDMETGESLWSISDEGNNYYIGVSSDLMPPNDSWEPIKKVGKYPSPGLVFYNTTQRLVDIYSSTSAEDYADDAEDSDDGFIEINYEQYQTSNRNQKKRMSRIGLNALNDPSSINHPSIVYEHLNQLKEEESGSLTSEDDAGNEWKTRYQELVESYDESQEIIKELRQTVQDLNGSFYDYWLKDKQQKRVNDKLQKTVSQQSEELFEQNKAEVKLINKIKDKTTHHAQINSLYDLEQLFVDNNNNNNGAVCLDLEVVHQQNVVDIESETTQRNIERNAHITELKQENMRLNALYHGLMDEFTSVQHDNKALKSLYGEIERLKKENIRVYDLNGKMKRDNMDLQTENTQRNVTNVKLKQLVRDLKAENRFIIESKLGLINSTATEIVKLKNTINAIVNMRSKNVNSTVIRKLYLR